MMKHSKKCPRHTAIVFSVFLCMSCLSAFPVPASAQEQEGRAVCYTLTEMPDGWHYADENGNVLKERLIPNKRLLPVTGASDEKELPSRYDAREDGLVTSVKKQIGGTCWAYGAIGAAESNMIKKGMADATLDLSEAHLIWFGRGQGSPDDPSNPLYGDGAFEGVKAYRQGGGICWLCAPLAAWEGVVNEADVPAHELETPIDESFRFKSVAHMQNMRLFSQNDIRSIKETILEKGALSLSYFVPSNVECLSEQYGFYQNLFDPNDSTQKAPDGGSHTVTLIGWDDNFPKENFIETPPGDGAWLLRNNWGVEASRTDKGFYYISYYDKSIGDITLLDMESTDNYSSIYQYDGDSSKSYTTGFGADTGFIQANVFEAKKKENVTAVGFYINDASTKYEAAVYLLNDEFENPRDGELITEVSGEGDYRGYYTVPLPAGCCIPKGKKFSVVIKTSPCARTTCHFDRHCFAPKTSYFTVYNAESEEPWTDCYEDGRGNVCVKAYTKDGLGICESLCPNPYIREHLSAVYDTDHDQIVSDDEMRAVNVQAAYDITGNESVDARDLTVLKRAVLGEQKADSGMLWYYGDWNADLRLDAADVRFLCEYLCQRPHR